MRLRDLVGEDCRKGEGSGQASCCSALACERRHPGNSLHCPLVAGSHGVPRKKGQGSTEV